MPLIDFHELKQRVSMADVLALLGWTPTVKLGLEQRGRCPFHESNSRRPRSFACHPDGWYCHKCQRGGDQLRLYAEVKGLDVYHAALELCERLRIKVPCLLRWNGEEER